MAEKSKEVYCSAILTNGMEYMLRSVRGWEALEPGATTFKARTLDGKPIVLSMASTVVLREVSEEEFELWKKSLEKYREEKLREAQVTNLSTN